MCAVLTAEVLWCKAATWQYKIYKTLKQNIRNVTLNDSTLWPQKLTLLRNSEVEKI